MKIVSIVGRKNTGKTSLTVKVIEELKKRGYKVASVKHSHHTMEMDRENTDTWKHKKAGSEVVVGIGSTTFFNIQKTYDLDRLLYLIKHIENVDFVVIEGFKKYNYPKIATSSDVVDEYTIKQVDSFTITRKGIEELADLIEEKGHDIVDTLFMNNCGFNNGEQIAKEIRDGNITSDDLDYVETYLSVDNNVVGLNRFVSDYIKKTVNGILDTLNLEDYNALKRDKIELVINNNNNKIQSYSEIQLEVNDSEIKLNDFTKELLVKSLKGMVSAIKIEDDNIESIEIEIEKSSVDITVNSKNIFINKFTSDILKNGITSMIETVCPDDCEINTISITIKD